MGALEVGPPSATKASLDERAVARRTVRARSGTIALWVGALVVFGVALLLRVHALDRVGFNSDEAVYTGQALSISGSHASRAYFPVYRAHPLLFQAVISLVVRVGNTDFAVRLVSVAFGLGTVFVSYALGKLLYGRRAGLLGAAVLAAMPYHVIVSRQVLLDGPEVFFATISLYALARYRRAPARAWMIALAGSLGLAFLTKETAGLLLGSVFVYLALDPDVRVDSRDLVAGGVTFGAMALVYPLSIAFGGAPSNGGSFLVWQLLRAPNHTYTFYLRHAAVAIGVVVIAAAVAGLIWPRRERSWRETLLLAWIGVPVVFFELWPVKGFQYLLPIAPPVALLAGRFLAWVSRCAASEPLWRRGLRAAAVSAVVLSVTVQSWAAINAMPDQVLAGAGGLPAGREAGLWVGKRVPAGAQLMAIGASMANVIEYYGSRKVWGMSISTNPHDRNPVYQPVPNPDLLLRSNVVQYLIWDTYSAVRSPRSSRRLLAYVTKYHGRVVHSEQNETSGRVAVVIYEVHP